LSPKDELLRNVGAVASWKGWQMLPPPKKVAFLVVNFLFEVQHYGLKSFVHRDKSKRNKTF